MFLEKTNRRIVPRWRDFLTTCSLGELDLLAGGLRGRVRSAEIPPETRAAWRANGTLWHALDLIGAAFVVGELHDQDNSSCSAHTRVRRFMPAGGIHLARRILNPDEYIHTASEVESQDEGSIQKEIHDLRKRSIEEPRNSILWVDLGRLYTIVGNVRKATKAIEIACNLAGENRFVLRSASRFFVHIGEIERALRVIRRSASVTADPWLTAAEIGISCYGSATPRSTRAARKMLDDDNFSEFSKTELASALGTLELLDGKPKLAKKLIRQSLASPTENSLAQAQWRPKASESWTLTLKLPKP